MIIDEIVYEFKKGMFKLNKKINIDWGSDDVTKTEFRINNEYKGLFDVDFTDDNTFKQAIIDNIDDFYIEQCMQVWLEIDSSDKARRELEKFYPIEKENVKEYVKKFNSMAKYWRISIDIEDIEDNCGWQFLEFPHYILSDYAIKQLKNELKRDETMFEDLIARVRIYKAKGDIPYQHRPYELKLISDKTETFKDINRESDRNNCSKAEFIFNKLIENGVDDDNYDGSDSNYDNIKKVEAIILANNDLHTISHNLQYEPRYRGRDGWEICGIDLTRVIMFKFTLTDNTIIRFDFQGMIDNEEGTQGIYFHDIIDKNAEANERYNKEKAVKDIIKEISDKYECYIYTAFDDDNDNISSMDNINGYDDEYACCIEIFSDLAMPIDYKEANFGITDEYIDRIIEIREDTLKESAKIEAEYNQYAVKTTTSKWNQGCEGGMAIYVWIPYQEDL